MKCPSCKDVELVEVLTTKGVMVDVCPQCYGAWLDKGELEEVQIYKGKIRRISRERIRQIF